MLHATLIFAGSLGSAFCAWVWFMRATADVGEPLPIVYVLTVVSPVVLAVGLWLRQRFVRSAHRDDRDGGR